MKDHEIDGMHTIPVPYGWSTECAWEAIVRDELIPWTLPLGYELVEVRNGRLVRIW